MIFAPLLTLLSLGGPWLNDAHAERPRDQLAGDWRPTDLKTIEKVCRKYDRVQGKVIVGPDFEGEDLSAIACIRGVGDSLIIEGAPKLRSLAGIGGIHPPKGVPLRTIRVEGNPELQSIDALNAIDGLRVQSLIVKNNPSLRGLDLRFEVVSGGGVIVSGNSGLGELRGPDGLPTGAALRELEIMNNATLSSISGFDFVYSVDALTLTGNPRLLRVEALPRLRTARELMVRGMPTLRELTLGAGLESVDRLTLADLDALERAPTWASLSRVGVLSITENARLSSIDGLLANRAGAPVVDRLILEDNPALDPAALAAIPRMLRTRPDAVRMVGNGPQATAPEDEPGPRVGPEPATP